MRELAGTRLLRAVAAMLLLVAGGLLVAASSQRWGGLLTCAAGLAFLVVAALRNPGRSSPSEQVGSVMDPALAGR